MPRRFTPAEREAIRARLRAAARDSIARVGIRRTSVDELVAAAAISKGAFYGFYASKEALVMDVLLDVEGEVRRELDDLLRTPAASPRAAIARMLRFLFGVLDRHPVLRVLADPGETASLFRSVPPEAMARHADDDDRYFNGILEAWRRQGVIEDVDPEVFSGLPRAAMALVRQREFIGADRFEGIVELFVESLAAKLAAESCR